MNDCISRYAVSEWLHNCELHLLADMVLNDNKFPSVTPERPKGKWMECGGDEPWLKGYCCSICNFTTTIKYNYCTCGAEMERGEE